MTKPIAPYLQPTQLVDADGIETDLLVTPDRELVTMDWHAAAAAGWITGASVFTSNGIVANATAVNRQPLCSLKAINYATGAGIQMSYASDSAEDGSGGTGILTMAVSHIRQDYSAQTELATLNGVTPVASTVTDSLFINDMTVITAGNANGEAVGTIYASNGGTNYAVILPGETRQFSSYRMIPGGKVFIPSSIIVSSVSGSSGQSTMRLVFKLPTSDYFIPTNEIGVQDNTILIPLVGGRSISAGTIMGADETSTKATSSTAAIIGIIRNV